MIIMRHTSCTACGNSSLFRYSLAEHAVLGSRRLGTMGAQAHRRHRFHLYRYSNEDYRAERITVHPAGATSLTSSMVEKVYRMEGDQDTSTQLSMR